MCIGGVGYYMHASHQPYFETVCHILHYLKGAPVICYLLSVPVKEFMIFMLLFGLESTWFKD